MVHPNLETRGSKHTSNMSQNNQKIKPTDWAMSLYYDWQNKKLAALLSAYVDDTLEADKQNLKNLTQNIERNFES